jgi:hypothetical protein
MASLQMTRGSEMLDHCVRCGKKTLEIERFRRVLIDKAGQAWVREDLRCSVCGWTDMDYLVLGSAAYEADRARFANQQAAK